MCRYRNDVKLRRRAPKMKRRSLPTVREEPTRGSNIYVYCVVSFAAVLSYINSFNGEFVHDDIPALVTNPDVIGTNSIQQVFVNDFWGTPMSDVNSHKSYRPLTTLSFRSSDSEFESFASISNTATGSKANKEKRQKRKSDASGFESEGEFEKTTKQKKVKKTPKPKSIRLNHALTGLSPWSWHACNVLLHAVCCVLVARTCLTVARLTRPFSTLAAVLFAVHPVHTEAVAGIVGRADVLACIFFLASLLVYHRPGGKKKYVWLSILLGALSMLAKETGVTILLLNLAFDIYRCWPFLKRSLNSLKNKKKCKRLSVRTTEMLVSLTVLVGLRLALLQGSLPVFSSQDNPAAFHPSFFVRFMTFCYLAAFNWWLLLCPWGLSHDWQMSSVPIITSCWDPRNLLTSVALGAMLMLCYRCFADLELQRHTPAVIGLMFLVIPFMPASNMFITVGFVIAERVLYIPSIGTVIMTAYGAQLLWHSKPGTKVCLVIGLAVLTTSSVMKTFRRNEDWQDRVTLLRADLVTLPQNAKLHYNFGNYLRENSQRDEAIKHYNEALRLWPAYASAHNNIGTLMSTVNNAELHFLQAIKFNRRHVKAHYNLGKLYKKSGHMEQAIKMLEICIWLQPRFRQAHLELLTIKPEAERITILQRLMKVDPGYWGHYVLYGDWLRNKGIHLVASKYFIEAARLSFKHRYAESAEKSDLISVRSAALAYRSLGQKSRILQLLTRWHTWRRGWHNPAVTHIYLRDQRLKMDIEKRVRMYSNAITSTKSTTCFDLSILDENSEDKTKNKDELIKNNKYIHISEKQPVNDKDDNNNEDTVIASKTCGTRTSNVPISSQIKTKLNKLELKVETYSKSGLKAKTCSKHKKDKKNTNTSVIPSIGAHVEQNILTKTF